MKKCKAHYSIAQEGDSTSKHEKDSSNHVLLYPLKSYFVPSDTEKLDPKT